MAGEQEIDRASDDDDADARRSPQRVDERRIAVVVGAATGLALFALMVVSNLDLLSARIVPWGDSAANSLLVDRALEGRQLVGHYSRAQFSHPGPAFLYVQAAGELVFHRWSGVATSPYAGWVLGVVALNAALLGWVTGMVRRWTGSSHAALLLPLLALLVNAWNPSTFVNEWGPTVIVVPFLVLLVSGAFLADHRWSALLPFTAALGLLVHGHLSSLLFAGAVALAVIAQLWWSRRHGRRDAPTTREWVAPAVLAGLFALPIVLHVLLDWPGELRKYLSYARGNAGRTSGGLGEVADFVAGNLFHGPLQTLAVVVSLVVVLLLRTRLDDATRAIVDRSLIVLAVATGAFLLYSWRTVDELDLEYLGWFAMAIPVMVLWLGGLTVLVLARRSGPGVHEVVGVVGIIGIGLVAALTVDVENHNRGVGVLEGMVEEVAEEPTRLTFEAPSWPTAIGVLAGAVREGAEVCLVDASWEFMVTEDHLCTAADDARIVEVATPDAAIDPSPEDLLRTDGYALVLREPAR